jgi:glycine oxidase
VIGAGVLDGLYWATGHYRNGVLLAPITADILAAVLTGDDHPAAAPELAPSRFTRTPVGA